MEGPTRGLEMYLQSKSHGPPFPLCQLWNVFPFQSLSSRKKSDLGLPEKLPSTADHLGSVLHPLEIWVAGLRSLLRERGRRSIHFRVYEGRVDQHSAKSLPFSVEGFYSSHEKEESDSEKETNSEPGSVSHHEKVRDLCQGGCFERMVLSCADGGEFGRKDWMVLRIDRGAREL